MDRLENGWSSDDYHRNNLSNISGLNTSIGSNNEKLLKLLDNNSFTTIQALEEQDKAHDINYAHGLELDDIGDDSDISRNNIDDATYRFYLKAHNLVKESQGTFPELINIASTLLGCDEHDVRLVPTQKIDDAQRTSGEPDTIQIQNLDITKIQNTNLIPLLESEMQKACAGAQRIEQIDFSFNVDMPFNLSVGMGATIEFNI